MNLLCISDFNQGDVTAKAGDIVSLPEGAAHRLLDSWPACWAPAPIVTVEEVAEPEIVTEAIDAPPKDKMMHAPHKAKGKRKG